MAKVYEAVILNDGKTKAKELRLRNVSAIIVDVFECILDKYDSR